MTEDQKYMKMTFEFAEMGRGRTSPNPMVGAVVVKDGKVVGEGFHERAGSDHAEVVALRAAGACAGGATIYLNLEPCSVYGKTPPCTEAIIRSGIKKAVIATIDPNPLVSGNGIRMLREAGIEVDLGTLEPKARKINEIFATFITQRRPFVMVKAAMSFDGKIAHSKGESRWISGEESRKLVHRLRNEFDAVLVGVNTVINDDPSLTARGSVSYRNPLRIVLDSKGKLPSSSKIARSAKEVPTLLATTNSAPSEKMDEFSNLGIKTLVLSPDDGWVNLDELLIKLGNMGIASLLVEGGSAVNGSFSEAGYVDKFIFFLAPIVIAGVDAPGPVGGQGFASLNESLKLRFSEVEFLGQDIVVEAYPVEKVTKVTKRQKGQM